QARLFVEQRKESRAQRKPAVVALAGPPRREVARVLGIGLQGVDRGIEACLRALDVERPIRLDVALGVRRDRRREVPRRRTDRADDGYRAGAAAEWLDQRRTLVEVGQSRRQV